MLALTLALVPTNIVVSVLDGLTGAAIFNLLPSVYNQYGERVATKQSDYAANVAASGGALAALGFFAALLLLRVSYLSSLQAKLPKRVSRVTELCSSGPKTILHAFKSSKAAPPIAEAVPVNQQATSSSVPLASIATNEPKKGNKLAVA